MTYTTDPDQAQRPDVNPPVEGSGTDPDANGPLTVKVCPRCSVQSQTAGTFCPHCAASYNGHGSRAKISRRIVIAAVAALVVIGSATGLAVKVSHDNEVTAQRVAAAHALKLETDAAKAKADADLATAATKQAADDQTRTERKASVAQLEASILKDAKGMVKSQTLTGPIFSVSCTPLGGGSADDLTAVTGTFECIAVNKKNADGSSSGYQFAATINWNKDYTWHLGS
jgi:hypothetical protein